VCRHIGETRMLDSGSAALSIVESHLRRRSATADSSCGEFAHFNLGAHFLDLRGLLFQLGRERLFFNRSTLRCSLRNSLSNIALIESRRRASGFSSEL